jgi:hypothetical protein
MNSMKNIILCGLVALFIVSCGKINTPNADAEMIFGTWRFVYSSGGFSGAGNSSYDATDTYEYKENGTFSHRKDGQLIGQISFSLQLGPSIYSQTEQLLVNYGGGTNKQSFQISNDTLFLSDEVFDGFQYIFVKD